MSKKSFFQKFKAQLQALYPMVCHYCGEPVFEEKSMTHEQFQDPYYRKRVATADHVVPRCRGGAPNDVNNMVIACLPCNSKQNATRMHAEAEARKVRQ